MYHKNYCMNRFIHFWLKLSQIHEFCAFYHQSSQKCSQSSHLSTVLTNPSWRALNHRPWTLRNDHDPSLFLNGFQVSQACCRSTKSTRVHLNVLSRIVRVNESPWRPLCLSSPRRTSAPRLLLAHVSCPPSKRSRTHAKMFHELTSNSDDHRHQPTSDDSRHMSKSKYNIILCWKNGPYGLGPGTCLQ